MILDWCSFTNNDRNKLIRSFHDIFQSIYKLKLEWIKILPINTSFGGWVSENWLAFGRILRWAFSTIDDMDSSLDMEKNGRDESEKVD